LSSGEVVHGGEGDDEVWSGYIDGEDVDRFGDPLAVNEGELPARAAIRVVKAGNGRGAPDVRETGEGAKSGESAGQETIGAIGTSDSGQGASGVIVDGVKLDVNGRDEGGESRDGSKGGEELHGEEVGGLVSCLVVSNYFFGADFEREVEVGC